MTDYAEYADENEALRAYERDREIYSLGPMFRDSFGIYTYSRSIS